MYEVIGQLCEDLGCIFVQRDSPESRAAAKEAVEEHVRSAHLVATESRKDQTIPIFYVG